MAQYALPASVCAIEKFFQLQAKRGRFSQLLATISFGTAALFFALLALRDEVHLLAIRFGDALGNDTFIEAANELFDSFAFTTFNSHSAAGSTVRQAT